MLTQPFWSDNSCVRLMSAAVQPGISVMAFLAKALRSSSLLTPERRTQWPSSSHLCFFGSRSQSLERLRDLKRFLLSGRVGEARVRVSGRGEGTEARWGAFAIHLDCSRPIARRSSLRAATCSKVVFCTSTTSFSFVLVLHNILCLAQTPGSCTVRIS
ncbi:hypothetical protein B0H34DRAFT_715280 [Crassisporium funariophilum]|nr:hypothetical protein B0H34DRAFT_715280 [Crassisporium funariophilum]